MMKAMLPLPLADRGIPTAAESILTDMYMVMHQRKMQVKPLRPAMLECQPAAPFSSCLLFAYASLECRVFADIVLIMFAWMFATVSMVDGLFASISALLAYSHFTNDALKHPALLSCLCPYQMNDSYFLF